ncbi:hypothetical protein D3C75_700840 [compost metagenome]
MSLVASSTALPSADICVPWLRIEPPLAISVRSPPAASWLTRASLVEWLCSLLDRWLPAVTTVDVVAARRPEAAPSAVRVIRPIAEPLSAMPSVVESRALR